MDIKLCTKRPATSADCWISQQVWLLSCLIICLAVICVRCLLLGSIIRGRDVSTPGQMSLSHSAVQQDDVLSQSGPVCLCYDNKNRTVKQLIYGCRHRPAALQSTLFNVFIIHDLKNI